MPIKSIDPYKCSGCGMCEESCALDVIRMKDGKVYIAYPEDCSTCYICSFVCPRDAIEIVPIKKVSHWDIFGVTADKKPSWAQ